MGTASSSGTPSRAKIREPLSSCQGDGPVFVVGITDVGFDPIGGTLPQRHSGRVVVRPRKANEETITMQTHRGFGEQTRHYFDRLAIAAPDQEVISPAGWQGADMSANPDRWLVELSTDQIEEIGQAADVALDAGIAMEEVSEANFALPTLAADVTEWRRTLANGVGVVCVRGLPVRSWGTDKSALAFWGLGHHLGIPGAQNPANELLGHVTDYGESASAPLARLYRTAKNIAFHCDTADVVGLLCLRAAKHGGQSRIASSVYVFNELLRTSPELASELFEPFDLDRRDEQAPGDAPTRQVTPSAWDGQTLRTFWHSDYMRSAIRHDGIEFSDRRLATIERFDDIANQEATRLDMWLEEGDMQFVSNHSIVHARTEYEDHDDLDERRHLLRLWLSLS